MIPSSARSPSGRLREIRPEEFDFSRSDATDGFDFNRDDRRRHQRTLLDVPVSIELRDTDGTKLGQGHAVLKDLSLDGACLTDLDVTAAEGKNLEGKSPRIHFRITEGPFQGVEAVAKPVRPLALNGSVGVSLENGFQLML